MWCRVQACSIAFPLLMTLGSGACHAQQLAYAPAPRPTVSRAVDFVSFAPSSKVGEAIKFTRLDTPEAKKISAANLQVRIFSLAEGESAPSPSLTIDDCSVYLTAIYPLHGAGNHDMVLATPDAGWLTLSASKKSYDSGRYFIVIETAGADDRVFRLKTSDAVRYFSQGVRLTVDAGQDIPLDEVKRLHAGRLVDAADLVQRVNMKGDSIPCYRYVSHKTVLAEAGPDGAEGELLACR